MTRWIVAGWLMWAPLAWADTVAYYEVATGRVSDTQTAPGIIDPTPNLARKGEGWEAVKVGAVPTERLAGQALFVRNGQVVAETDPLYVEPPSVALRKSAKAHLMAGQPLTADEAQELVK